MDTSTRAARTIAVLLLLQMSAGPVVNFVLVGPALPAAPGFLTTAPDHATQIGVGVLIGLVMGALSIAIAVAAWPVFARHSQAMAQWLLALATAAFAATVVENIGVMSMLSLAQAHAQDIGDAGAWQTVAVAVGAARKWAHYLNLIVVGGFTFVFYAGLCRFKLVAHALSLFGLVAVASMFVAVTMPLFGQPIVFGLLAPLGLAQIALVIWLFAKGFAERDPT